MKNPDADLFVMRFSFAIAMATTTVTLVAFAIAVSTPPLSGPFCPEGCFEYPYHDIASRFPRDYYWMFPAMVFALLSIALLVIVHYHAEPGRRIFSMLSVCMGTIGSGLLFTDYFVQVVVIPPSLFQREFEGLALLTQFNPHGIFIALEEAGYLLLNLAFFVMVPVFCEVTRSHRAIRITGIAGFAIAILSLTLVSLTMGLEREYIFEVIIILVVWVQLITISAILSREFYRALRN